MLAELLDVLSRGKFAARLAQAGLTPEGIVGDLRRIAVVVSPASVPRVVPTDPHDDHVLAAALAGAADIIASGDKRDLLPWAAMRASPSSLRARRSSGLRQEARPDTGGAAGWQEARPDPDPFAIS